MRNKLFYLFVLHLFIQIQVFGQSKPLTYYLPPTAYSDQITTPEAFLGFQIGDWHVSHDQVKAYCQLLARESNRVIYREYAKSHENRALFTLTISSESNISNLGKIKERHRKSTSWNGVLDVNNPLIIYQGYSIHGNESSGANAALLIAYHLAAGQSKSINHLLKNSVILIDPCMNPDGLQRFSSWVNMNKSKTLVSDPVDREYNEPWPKGRTNHYWSDLNRDWLLLTHPESQGRVKLFQEWRPHILTDHHEMGKDGGFFFQPGVPERTNPITPNINQKLTEEIGTYHAKALDKIGSSYFTKKRFDDYYYGKGSTYPDLQGCIGILFEQASSRGHYQENQNGILDFPFTIRNQVVTSISTQEAAMSMIELIKSYKVRDVEEIKKEAKKKRDTYYIISRKKYREKADYFANILHTHAIQVFFDKKNNNYIIPIYQRQYRLLKTIFERVNQFPSNEFYDVSTWTLPLAFDIEYAEVRYANMDKNWLSYEETTPLSYHTFHQSRSAKHHIIPWGQWNTTKLLNALLRDTITTHMYTGKDKKYSNFTLHAGDIILPTSDFLKIKNKIDQYPVEVYPLSEQLTDNEKRKIELPKIAMIVGKGTSTYEAGDIWYQLDTRMNLPVTKMEKSILSRIDLNRYTHIILPSGNHSLLNTAQQKQIKKWVQNGGIFIAMGKAIQWTQSANLLHDIEFTQPSDSLRTIEHRIGGAIYEIRIPSDSPFKRGYQKHNIPLFKKGTWVLNVSKKDGFEYSKNPLLSGYSSPNNQKRIKNSSVLISQKKGKGQVIGIVDNPLFRGYWLGGITLFENLIYMSSEL